MNRTIFLVDGFNLYHSLIDAQRDSGGSSAKWLDLKKKLMLLLPSSFLKYAILTNVTRQF